MKSLTHASRALLCLLATLLALAAPGAGAELRIVASALFDGRALLTIEGTPRMLRVGETSPEGVTLLAASAREAIIGLQGRREVLAPGRDTGGGFAVPARREVAIARGPQHGYAVSGTINGLQVRMLVDTGASVVALNAREAERLRLDYRSRGVPATVQTAGGVAAAWSVTLDRVEVSGIVARNVAAAVVEGDFPIDVLLGMSWLGRVTMHEADGVLYLREK